MAEPSAEHWYPTAAYLYTLHLDGPALAWEYLRRNPDYRRNWLRRRRRPQAAQRWGLRLLEDPDLDARDAHPVWFPDHDGVIQLYPDADPPPDRSEEHTSELQSLMRISYDAFGLKKHIYSITELDPYKITQANSR